MEEATETLKKDMDVFMTTGIAEICDFRMQMELIGINSIALKFLMTATEEGERKEMLYGIITTGIKEIMRKLIKRMEEENG